MPTLDEILARQRRPTRAPTTGGINLGGDVLPGPYQTVSGSRPPVATPQPTGRTVPQAGGQTPLQPQTPAPAPQNPYAAPAGGSFVPITPGQDLRAQAITPTGFRGFTQADTGGLNDLATRAFQGAVSRTEGIGAPALGNLTDLAFGADTQGLRQGVTSGIQNLSTAPNRAGLAQQAFGLLQQESDPAFQQQLRQVGQRAASLGRLGAGMTTSNLGDVASERNRYLANEQQRLSLGAAEAELADRLNILGATQSGLGQLAGLDTATTESRNRNVLDRFGAGIQGAELGLRGAGQLGNLAGLAFGEGRAQRGEAFDRDLAQYGIESGQRNELRGERGYQNELESEAQRRAVDQRFAEEALLQGQFGRNLGEAGLFRDLGYGYDPTAALQYGAGQYGQQASDAFGGVGDFVTEYMLRNQGRRPPGSSALPPDWQDRN